MIAARHIGKESNDWERQAFLGLNAAAQPDYGIGDTDRHRLFTALKALVSQIGHAKAAKALGTTPARLKSFSPETVPPTITARLPAAVRFFEKLRVDRETELARLREAVQRDGLRYTARRLGVDPSNLGRMIREMGVSEPLS
jgi:transcriptional regulator with GAF, ATPase, and Fis domain